MSTLMGLVVGFVKGVAGFATWLGERGSCFERERRTKNSQEKRNYRVLIHLILQVEFY